MSESEELMHRHLDEVGANGNIGLIDYIEHADMIDEANVAFGGGHPGVMVLWLTSKDYAKIYVNMDNM